MSDTTTPKRNEAVATTRHDAGFEDGPIFHREEWMRLKDLPKGTQLFTGETVDALHGEVSRLRAVLAAIRNPIAAAPEHAFGVHYEGPEQPSWPIRDEMLSSIDKALNLEPPTDGRA